MAHYKRTDAYTEHVDFLTAVKTPDGFAVLVTDAQGEPTGVWSLEGGLLAVEDYVEVELTDGLAETIEAHWDNHRVILAHVAEASDAL